jgi:adenylate kinase
VGLNVLLLGVQGSGKGTQAKRIAAEYGIPHIATGDMLRNEIAAGTPLGVEVKSMLESGDLVPDATMIELIRARLDQAETEDGFVLDGFPRTMAQAEALDAMLAEIGRPLTIVLELQVPDEVAVARMRKRAAEEGRTDDNDSAIARRLELYHQETAPIVSHYRAAGNLVGIHGNRPVNEVFAEIQEALEQAAVRR